MPSKIVEGDYEMSFFPVDSGNPDIWEGLIYFKRPGSEGTYAVAHDTLHQDLSQAGIYYEDFYPAGGGGDFEQVRLPEREGSSLMQTIDTSTVRAAPHAFGRFQAFLQCVGFLLPAVFYGCLATGPAYWACVIAGIGIAIALCSSEL
jgi:hypothetical protein